MDQKKIGKYIAEKRKTKNLTQAQLADMMGVGYKAVSKWERGLSLPDVSKYQELCSILGITLNELFAGEDLEEESIALKSEQNIIEIANSNDKQRKQGKLFIAVLLCVILVLSLTICRFVKENQYLLVWDYDITLSAFEVAENAIAEGKLSDREILKKLSDDAFNAIWQSRDLTDSMLISSRWYSEKIHDYLFECTDADDLSDKDVDLLLSVIPVISEELNQVEWETLRFNGRTIWFRKDIFNAIKKVDNIADEVAKSIPAAEEVSNELVMYDWDNYVKHHDDPIPVISLADKRTLSDGKYGFYKKITFDETVEVYLELIGTDEKECKNVRYGIYEDSKLEIPIEEHFFIDWGDESYLEGEFNIRKPVPENEDGEVTLEPGTYYLGLFTTDPRDDFEVEIEGYYKSGD